jgi:hypothetical protein
MLLLLGSRNLERISQILYDSGSVRICALADISFEFCGAMLAMSSWRRVSRYQILIHVRQKDAITLSALVPHCEIFVLIEN